MVIAFTTVQFSRGNAMGVIVESINAENDNICVTPQETVAEEGLILTRAVSER